MRGILGRADYMVLQTKALARNALQALWGMDYFGKDRAKCSVYATR
jgi:hypothetical protein